MADEGATSEPYGPRIQSMCESILTVAILCISAYIMLTRAAFKQARERSMEFAAAAKRKKAEEIEEVRRVNAERELALKTPQYPLPGGNQLGKYITVGPIISRGCYGDVYAFGNDRVIKVMDRQTEWWYEVKMHSQAVRCIPEYVVDIMERGRAEGENLWYIVYTRMAGCFNSSNGIHERYADQVFVTFADCWTRGVYHFDVKAANILVDRDGEAPRFFLHDWGVACAWISDLQDFHCFNFQLFLGHIHYDLDTERIRSGGKLNALLHFIVDHVLNPFSESVTNPDPRFVMGWISLIAFRSLFGYSFPQLRFRESRFHQLALMDDQLRQAKVIHTKGYDDWAVVFRAIAATSMQLAVGEEAEERGGEGREGREGREGGEEDAENGEEEEEEEEEEEDESVSV